MASDGVVLVDDGLFREIVCGKYVSASNDCAINFFQCIFAQQLVCAAARSLTPLTVCKDGRSHREYLF